jgi:hypothetical protein
MPMFTRRLLWSAIFHLSRRTGGPLSFPSILRSSLRTSADSEFSGGKGKSFCSFLPKWARIAVSPIGPISGCSNLLSFAGKAPSRECSVSGVNVILLSLIACLSATPRVTCPGCNKRPENAWLFYDLSPPFDFLNFQRLTLFREKYCVQKLAQSRTVRPRTEAAKQRQGRCTV